MINRKYRNTVTKAWTIPGWRANPMQQRQHSVICMTITLKLLQIYYTPIKPETGLRITYDIKEMRDDTTKLEKWYKQR